MALVTINRNPSPKELRWFGALLGAFLAFAGHLVSRKPGIASLAPALWALAVTLPATYYALPRVRRPIYLGWTYLTFPIGMTVSWVVLSLVYFGVVTPVGLALRLSGRDPLQRGLERERTSYWTDHPTGDDPRRYFKQY